MGLDGVELVMAVEEEFKIVIPDSDAFQADTVGKLVDLVHSRLRQTAQESCPSQHGFYMVRKQIMDRLGVARSEIKPDSELGALIAKPNRRTVWRDIISSLTDGETTCPALVRPRWLNRIVLLGVPAIAFLVTLKWVPLHLFLFGFLAAIAVAIVGDRLTTPFMTEFPSDFSHVKDLIRYVKAMDSRIWSKDDVLEKIREISVEILRVKPETVTLEASWVQDLGVG